MTFVDILKLGLAVIFANLGGVVSDRISRDNQEWFANLTKPAIYPPDYLFGPVRLIVYTLMGIASYLVYRDGGGFCTEKSRLPLSLYGIQMALSWAWIFIFYWFQSLNWSFVEGLFIFAVNVACSFSFHRVNKMAGWLFAPYVLWATFVCYLNYALYRLNPDGLEIA